MNHAQPITIALAFAAGLLAPVAHAQVYKCMDERKQPVYQDKPCAAGAEMRNLDTDPATLSVIPMRPVPGTTTRVATPPRPRNTPAGKAEKIRVGDPGERKHIHLGMHEGEVIARIGPADMTSGGKGRKLSRWTYMPVPGDPQTITTVVFDYGKVVEVERKVVK